LFVTHYNSLVPESGQIDLAIQPVFRNARTQSDRQFAPTLRRLSRRLQSEVGKLAMLIAPRNLSVDLDRLKTAATRVESDVGALVAAAAAHRGRAVLSPLFLTLAQDSAASRSASKALQTAIAGAINQKLGIK
jgi:hypothetical protein